MTCGAPWSVAVVIPARDEEATVGVCVTSVRTAMEAAGGRGDVVVVADTCADGTVAAARRALGPCGVVVTARATNVGRARRAGVDHVLRRYRGRLDRLWLATTDADSTVPPHWLVSQLALASSGITAVAGVIRLPADEHDLTNRRHTVHYVMHEDGSHPHVHGANLGVRADAYVDAGGWPGIATGEDHALWDALARRGWPRLASVSSWVTTSSRRTGRAPAGFAADLATLERAT